MHCDDALPEQCIVFDREFSPAPFYIRVRTEEGIDMKNLEDSNGPVRSLPAAIVISIRNGYRPTHWIARPGSMPMSIPPQTIQRIAAQFADDVA